MMCCVCVCFKELRNGKKGGPPPPKKSGIFCIKDLKIASQNNLY